VTVKHVLQDDKGQYFPEIFVRLNRKGKRPGIIPINLKGYKLHFHEDEIVDIAILMFYPDQNLFDYLYIRTSILARQK
jgi:hypothetical protein